MRIKNIEKSIIGFGDHAGKIATIITLGGVMAGAAKTLEKIVSLGEKLIVIQGDITNNPEIVPIIRDLTQTGYSIIVNTDSGEDISVLMRYKNLAVSLEMRLPKEGEETDFKPQNLGFLRDRDEVRFSVNNVDQYEEFFEFKRVKNINIPKRVLEIGAGNEEIKDLLLKEVRGTDNIIIRYI